MLANALLFEEDGWHISQGIEIDVASQGNDAQEAIDNLQEALTLHFTAPVSSRPGAFAGSAAEAMLRLPGAKLIELRNAQWQVEDPPQVCGDTTVIAKKFFATRISFRKVRFKLEAAGFDGIKQLGNHAKFVKRESGKIATAVLPHYQELSASVVFSILRQSGLSPQVFEKL
jgi:predicted RNase H-like HicB family nuclease/predicted RNA binding protein YcfA (HicA-like mRNA interferase family)